MHWPVASLRKTVDPEMLLGHGMKTQWPVASTPFPRAQMHAPISSSPSTQRGAGSALADGGVAGTAGAEVTAAGDAEAEAEAAAAAGGGGGATGAAAHDIGRPRLASPTVMRTRRRGDMVSSLPCDWGRKSSYSRCVGRLVGIGVRIAAVALSIMACDPVSPAQHASSALPQRLDLPWPVPGPSTSMEIPAELRAPAGPGSHLNRAADWLVTALHEAGYTDLAFYDVPGGFVVMPSLELVDDQGLGATPADPALRFSGKLPQTRFFTMAFWSELLARRKGRYRLFLFVVIDKPFGYSTDVTEGHLLWRPPSRELPLDRAEMPYDAHDGWYALVYEFEKAGNAPSAKLALEPVDPAVNLAKSGVLAALKREAAAK